MQIVTGLYRAFVEGMMYWRIAARCENDLAEMAKRINAAIDRMNRTSGLTAAEPVAVGGERTEAVEEVAGKAA